MQWVGGSPPWKFNFFRKYPLKEDKVFSESTRPPLLNTKIFADDTKVFNEIKNNSDYLNLQNAIDKLYQWSQEWLLQFNKNKCKVLHLGKNNPHYDYYIGDADNKIKITETLSEKDLGVYIDPLLTFESHIFEAVKKARKLSNLIMRTITLKNSEIMLPLYKTLIRSVIEYANCAWYPFRRKDIDNIEAVQRQFTKCIIGFKDYDYETRLKKLKLPSLEYRRIRGDLIETYKILNNLYDPLTTGRLLSLLPNTSSTRSNSFKLYKRRFKLNTFKYFFSNRIVNVWNSLSEGTVNAKTLNSFKNPTKWSRATNGDNQFTEALAEPDDKQIRSMFK